MSKTDTKAQISIVLTIPRPPSANAAFRNLPGGGRAKTDGYRKWREAVAWSIKAQRTGKVHGQFSVEIICPRPDNRRRDIDNLIKPVLDALVAAGVTEDDHKCVRVSAEWRGHSKAGDMTVFVSRADPS